MLPALYGWGRATHHTTNGRLHIVCIATPSHTFWLNLAELRWSACPHCLGWWTWPNRSPDDEVRPVLAERNAYTYNPDCGCPWCENGGTNPTPGDPGTHGYAEPHHPCASYPS